VRVRSLNHSFECYWALMTGDCPEQQRSKVASVARQPGPRSRTRFSPDYFQHATDRPSEEFSERRHGDLLCSGRVAFCRQSGVRGFCRRIDIACSGGYQRTPCSDVGWDVSQRFSAEAGSGPSLPADQSCHKRNRSDRVATRGLIVRGQREGSSCGSNQRTRVRFSSRAEGEDSCACGTQP